MLELSGLISLQMEAYGLKLCEPTVRTDLNDSCQARWPFPESISNRLRQSQALATADILERSLDRTRFGTVSLEQEPTRDRASSSHQSYLSTQVYMYTVYA